MSDEIPIDELIRRLPPKQRDALGMICMNDDLGIHPGTLKALLRKGLIESYSEVLPPRTGHRFDFPMRVIRHRATSLGVHIAYCQWASEQSGDEP